uniref:Uncharacterized protein n=1 Tax=Romanomermis culicivorax TaxID=13658 RepID=A0A915LDI8_ROMCU
MLLPVRVIQNMSGFTSAYSTTYVAPIELLNNCILKWMRERQRHIEIVWFDG